MKDIIYVKEKDIEKFKDGYNFLINKLKNNWRINKIDKLFIEIVEEYLETLEYLEKNKGELREWEYYVKKSYE